MIVPTCRVVVAFSYGIIASGSDPWNDVTHEVSVDPVGDVIIHIFTWKYFGNLGLLALPMTLATSSMCHVPSFCLMITAIPALTCRKSGSFFLGL